jgi:hypothetical protein
MLSIYLKYNLTIRSASYLASLIESSDQLNKRAYADFDSSDQLKR